MNAQTVQWSKTDGPYTGSVNLLTVDPAGNVFAMVPSVGIYRSTDRGGSWEEVSGLGFSLEPCLAADSSNNIYAGNLSSGLYESTDGGTSWHKTSLSGAATAAAVLPGDRICIGGLQTVSISSDHGKSWSTSSKAASDPVEVVSIAGDDSGRIFAGFRAIPATPAAPPSGGGLFMSPDSGRTWIDYGMDDTTIQSVAVARDGMVFIDAASSIFSAVHAPIPRQGTNWSLNQAGIPLAAGIISVQNDPSGHVVAITNQGAYVYNESTGFWSTVLPNIPSSLITSLYYTDKGVSYAGTKGDGIFYFDSSSAGWVQSGIFPPHVTSLGTNSSGDVLVGTDNGIYERITGTRFWQKLQVGLGGATVYQIQYAAPNNTLYAATSAGLYSLPEGNGNWSLTTSEWTYSFLGTPDQYYVGTSGGIMTTAYGLGGNWSSDQTIGLPLTRIYSLARDASNVLYAGTLDAGIFSSTDGIFWTQLGLATSMIFKTVKVIDISSSGTIFVGTDTSGAYYSDDAGSSWNRIASITGKQITCFLLSDSAGYYAGTSDDGVFVSTDRGLSWHPADEGLTQLKINSILLDRQGHVYAGTDSGLFVSDGIVSGIHSQPIVASSFSLSQNYPNPFNPTTTIRFEIGERSRVALEIFNSLGQRVKYWNLGMMEPGTHEKFVTMGRFASGVYFYRLIAGSFVKTRKMMLIK